jgi:type II secretory pathway predicted ATPase ExeA
VIQAARALSAPAAAPSSQPESDSFADPAPSTPLGDGSDLRDSSAAPESTPRRAARPRRRLLNLFPESALQPEPAASPSGPQLVFLPRVASQPDAPASLDTKPDYTPPSVDQAPKMTAVRSRPQSRRVSKEHVNDELLAAIRTSRGPVVLTAPAGTSTLTLCRAVIQGLDRRTVASLALAPKSFDELLKMVLVDLGVMTTGSAAHADVPRPRLVDALHSSLGSLASLSARAVVFVDEAESVPATVLGDLHAMGARFDAGLLQLVLVGRPELTDLLADPALYDFDASIAQRLELDSLRTQDADAHAETPVASAIVDAPATVDAPGIESTATALEFETPRRSASARLLIIAAVASLALAGAGALLWAAL